MTLLEVIVVVLGGGTVLLVAIGLRRMGMLGGTQRASSGFAGGLAAVNEALQPQQPTVEVLAQAKEQEEEDEDEGDDVGRREQAQTRRSPLRPRSR